MPNIVEYTAQGEITPSDKGIQTAELAARRIGSFYHQIGESAKGVGDAIEQHMGVMETSELYKSGTELENNATQQLEQASSEAMKNGQYDPNFANHFMATFSPLVDKWASGASTDRGKLLAAEMGARIRESVFRRAAAGQSAMDNMQVETNGLQTIHNLSNSLYDDPSYGNYIKVTGTAEQFARESASHIHDIEQQQATYTSIINRIMPDMTIARYKGMEIAARRQIGLSDDETASKALSAYDDAVGKEEGFEHLTAEQKNAVRELREEAVKGGHSDFRIAHDTAKSQLTEQGKAAYAEIHTAITALALKGQGPTPDIVDTIGRYSRTYGATNPGEVASLDDYIVRGQDRAQEGKVEPFNQQTRDNIQGGMSLPKGDPRRPSLASLTKAWSSGQITKEDLGHYTEILTKLDKPETDPSFKPAWENFVRWQTQMIQSIGNKGYPGTAAARAQFLHDSTSNFMNRGRYEGSWDKALDDVTNVKNQHNFNQVMPFYQKAAQRPDAAGWLQQHGLNFDPSGAVTPAHGSTAAPIYPTAHTPAPASTQGSTPEGRKIAHDAIFGGQ